MSASEKTSISSGLDALFNTSSSSVADTIESIPIENLMPSPFQPRKQFKQGELEKLASSIQTSGILQPLIVRKQDAIYEIIAGERRWRAATMVGLERIPAIVKQVDDKTVLTFALIENLQREDLNPIEEAHSYERFQSEFGMNHLQIAELIGKSRSSIVNAIRLLSLCETAKEFLQEGKIDMGHARALLTLEPDQQISLAKKVIENNLNVRETEKLSQLVKLSDSSSGEQGVSQKNPYEQKYQYWSNKLSEVLPAKVTVKLNGKGKGKVVIHIESPDEIDWLVEHLKVER